MTYDPDSIHVAEEDRSLPTRVPDDRPMTPREQQLCWVDIMPEALRRGRHPSRPEEARALKELAQATLLRWGWMLNRLDWDREFPAHALEQYEVPTCAEYGHRRLDPRAIARLRSKTYPSPGDPSRWSTKPPYRPGLGDNDDGA